MWHAVRYSDQGDGREETQRESIRHRQSAGTWGLLAGPGSSSSGTREALTSLLSAGGPKELVPGPNTFFQPHSFTPSQQLREALRITD